MEDDKLEKNEQSEAIDEGQEQDSGEQKPEEEQAQEGEQEGAEQAEEQQEENPEAEKSSPPSSPRRDKRIKELLDRLHEKDEPSPEKKTGLNYRDALDADDDTIKQLEQDREAYGKGLFEEGLQRANSMQFHTRLEIDVPKIEAKYPQLDPRSAGFDADTLDEINQMYLHLSGYDGATGNVKTANLRYADFVDYQMNLADRIASKRSAESSRNIARQASQTAIRPNGSSAKALDLNKAPEQMTDEELDAVINQAIPPRTRRR